MDVAPATMLAELVCMNSKKDMVLGPLTLILCKKLSSNNN